MSRFVAQIASRSSPRVPTNEWKHTNTLQLRGLPKTALPSDIRRVCANAQVENIQSIALDYQRFSPTGDAFITFNTPSPIRSAVQKLHGSMIAGHALAAGPSPEDAGGAFLRNRGGKGRTQAAQRGVVTGNGPNGAITDLGKSVVLYGLPGKMTEEGVSFFVRSFKLDGLSATKEKDVIKLGIPSGSMSLTSRFLVRCESEAEAYRMVRKLHQTYYEPEIFDNRYRVRARVIH